MMFFGGARVVCVMAAMLLSLSQAATTLRPDPPMVCDSCAAWNAPHEPFRIFGNAHYVGLAGVSAVLITSDAGHILLDGGLSQSAEPIDRHIRQLGFRTEDVRLIVNSHAHYDHAGGIAALQRVSGATVAASPSGAQAIERGEPTPDDPQFAFGRAANAFPAVKPVRVVKDGDVLRVGALAITAHLTPGHTPGSTTWSWQSCEGSRCLSIVYADSLNAVSAPGFRFTGGTGRASIAESFRRSIDKVAALPCDIIISVHPEFTNLDGKLKRRGQPGGADAFIDNQSCRAYAAGASKRFDARIAEERASVR